MDKTDSTIINLLTVDARTSFRKIARELGVSPDTVICRYKALQEQGVIRGSTVVLDPKKIGYKGMAAFMIDTSPTNIIATEATPPEELSHILETLIKMPDVILATKTVGDHDMLAIAVIKDVEHLIETGGNIAKISGVKDLQVSFWVEKAELHPKYFII
ncbi:MAG: Lrp/AsnC family transcriptional regulator [Candidatus Bathyarchaeota archaeon]|nr:Lrp/AsnC family transcriptional regulator [Candidatus Bathyarchaeum tardum]WGM89760.1 MAG: Lrp/AsnC family transcriptional regulator [Candidatus Bathyarchaeum tardum]WNZ30146.1 MAG: Lrp/AsnC family transcriptional regulator [Candidatus Bathyarchaeota archaeon]